MTSALTEWDLTEFEYKKVGDIAFEIDNMKEI